MTEEQRSPQPWADSPDSAECNFALADLYNNLPRRLTINGRLHAETLLAASGAIAGYATQQAFLTEITAAPTGEHDVKRLTGKAGQQYLLSESLSTRLVATRREDVNERLWPLAASAAMACGLAESAVPRQGPMFTHVLNSLGSETEGYPSLIEHRPHLSVNGLLKVVWPLANTCFNSEGTAKGMQGRVVVSQRWRPVIAARAAHGFIRDVKSVVAPDKALIVLFESAIYASMLVYHWDEKGGTQ